ncbi:ABC transporter permease [Lacticaseibacillus suibinensis]|uniref:ABC transporter permease n=1 Tax=Lacticaseibacillus suibinensis TaxID=2486011 RepID=UPI00194572E1|nr:ABC transporter permease [Lacticaseibacillus suibinensis]
MTEAKPQKTAENKKIRIKFRWEYFLIGLLILEFVIFGSMNPRFLMPSVLLNSLTDYMSVCICALFGTFVMITGGIDIQQGAIIGLTSILMGILWQSFGMNILIAAVCAILIAGLCGAFSGVIVAETNVQPMVVTLGGSFLFSGLAIAVTSLSKTESYKGISGFPTWFTDFFLGSVGPFPYQFIVYIILAILAYVVLHKLQYGRKIFLIGVNKSTADFSGINSKAIIASTYIFSGLAAGIAGVMMTGYLGTAKADYGGDLTLSIVTAIVLGGTSNFGGKGGVVGTVLSSLIISFLQFGLSLNGMNTQYLAIPVGVLLILSLIIRSMVDHGTFRRMFNLVSNRGGK